MSLSPSPFVPGHPLRADQPIFGRDDAFSFVHGQVARFGSVNLVGERRMGKTSLLHHLLGNPQHRPPPGTPPLVLVAVDLQGHITDAAGFYGAALRGILRELPADPRFADVPARLAGLEADAHCDFAEFERWLRRLKDAGLVRPVVLVDEFERLLEPQYRAGFPIPGFFEGLRSLLTADVLALVVASRLPLAEHFERHPEAMTSTFPSYLPPFMLRELDDAAAERLLMQGMVFDLGLTEIQQARRWAGGHPCRLQCAGEAWVEAKRGSKDSAWAKARFEELAMVCRARPSRVPARVALRRLGRGLVRLPVWLCVDLPLRIGGAIQKLGEKMDQVSAWLMGFGAVVVTIGVIGHWLEIPWVLAVLEKLKGLFS
ncbi:AAA family ATPase [Methylomagnum sp.]